MKAFDGKVAVITGGADGIGLGVATALAAEGASLVLADVDDARLREAVDRLSAGGQNGDLAGGGRVIGVATDVADQAAVAALAARAYEEFGVVHVLHNNAGVFAGGASWEATDDDWEWLWNVNVGGIVNGLREFVPRMLVGGEEGHIINTASMAGIVSTPYSAAYSTTKFAAVGLSECLHHDLSLVEGCRIGVSVVCPSVVDTNIVRNDRLRPERFARGYGGDSAELAKAALSEAMTGPGAVSAEAAGRRIIDEVRAGSFYIATHDSYAELVGNANEDRLNQRPPRFQMFG